MKKLLLLLIFIITPLFTPQVVAESTSAVGTINTITEVINSLAAYGVFGTDVAKAKIGYFNDKIYLYGTELTLVVKESEEWTRGELWTIVRKKLLSLKDQGFLTNEQYESYIKSYSGTITTETSLRLGTVYKDFTRFAEETIDTAIPRKQKELYEKYRVKIADLLKANRITQEKHDMWLVKINTQVYQYKSDPDFMAREFDEEAARYTAILAPTCTPCSANCTTHGTNCPTSSSTVKASPDYSKEVLVQYGKQYGKMSLKTLQATLTRTKKLQAKYKAGTKNELKAKAMIELLNQEIIKKSTSLVLKK